MKGLPGRKAFFNAVVSKKCRAVFSPLKTLLVRSNCMASNSSSHDLRKAILTASDAKVHLKPNKVLIYTEEFLLVLPVVHNVLHSHLGF